MGRKSSTPQLPNFRARKQKSGVTYYYFDTGQKPRKEIPLGSNLGKALAEYSKLSQNGWSPPPEKAGPITFADVVKRYETDVIPKKAKNTQIGNARELKQLMAHFNDPPAPLDLSTPRHVREYMELRRKAPARANREKALLSHIFNTAREWGFTNVANPCAGVRGYREKGRSVYIEENVYKAVFDEAGPILQDAMDMAYLTAQRPSDVIGFTKADVVTFEKGALGLRVEQDKTGNELILSMTIKDTNELNTLGKLVTKLLDMKSKHARPSPALFCRASGQPITQTAMAQRFAKARKRAVAKIRADIKKAPSTLQRQQLEAFAQAVKQFQFRDLRAKAGTDKAASTGDMRQAQVQLGHSTLGMTEAYIRKRGGDRIDPTR